MKKSEFKMSMVSDLKFFLILQNHKSTEESFICQSKYTRKLIKKLEMKDTKSINIPINTTYLLLSDDYVKSVDKTRYHGMIDSFLYLIVT